MPGYGTYTVKAEHIVVVPMGNPEIVSRQTGNTTVTGANVLIDTDISVVTGLVLNGLDAIAGATVNFHTGVGGATIFSLTVGAGVGEIATLVAPPTLFTSGIYATCPAVPATPPTVNVIRYEVI